MKLLTGRSSCCAILTCAALTSSAAAQSESFKINLAGTLVEKPEYLVVVRLTPDALRSVVFSEVKHRGPVDRTVRGTRSIGESATTGEVVVDLKPEALRAFGPVYAVPSSFQQTRQRSL